MKWNHRVVRTEFFPDAQGDMTKGDDMVYAIKEVYYNDQGKPDGFTSAFDQGEGLQTLHQTYKWMMDAFKSPVLYFDGEKLVETTELYTPEEHTV